MRKLILVLAMVIFLMGLTVNANAETYFAVGGGGGGEADASNITFEFGGTGAIGGRNYLGAIGLSFIFSADDIPSGTLGYPCPHGDYTRHGIRQDGNEYALFGKYGLEIVKDKGLFIFALGGLSFAREITLAQSQITGWYYTHGSTTKTHVMLGSGLAYLLPGERISIQLEYDTRRGITGGIGYRW